MIEIACYFGSDVLQGPNGAYYNTQLQKMFNISPNLNFRDITGQVNQKFSI